jgi:CheY-like chemotaxis protein
MILNQPMRATETATPYVLLVEDEVLIRALLAETLRGAGLCVIEAANADEAWDYLQAGGQADLLFSDIQMPGSMNGVELARRVRERFPGVKLLLTSGNPGPKNITEVAPFLAKPYRLDAAAALALRQLGLDGP